MAQSLDASLLPHNDPALFRESITHTAGTTGFREELIEKDYFCSLILLFVSENCLNPPLFRGGTCLSKVYTDFYRLSEDLNFTISTPATARRSVRRRNAAPMKDTIGLITKHMPVFEISKPWAGFNNSTQYSAEMVYISRVTGQRSTVKIEVGLREEVVHTPDNRTAQTLLVNPLSGELLIRPFSLPCLSRIETYAEKTRAALTRRQPAIRDFFDLHYAASKGIVDVGDRQFIECVRQKLVNDAGAHIDMSTDRKTELARQLETELKPVLRVSDYEGFNFDSAFAIAEDLARAIQPL